MSDEETDYERGYAAGADRAYQSLLQIALRGLGQDSWEWSHHHWKVERAEAVSMLRQVCAAHGDNDWQDELHLADVIEKHLWRHLDRGRK